MPEDQQLPEPQTDLLNLHLKQQGIMDRMKQIFAWDMAALFTLHELMLEMVGHNTEVGFNKFTTPNGRNCILILGVGDGPTGILTDVAYKLTGQKPSK